MDPTFGSSIEGTGHCPGTEIRALVMVGGGSSVDDCACLGFDVLPLFAVNNKALFGLIAEYESAIRTLR